MSFVPPYNGATNVEEIPDTSHVVFLGITDKVVITPPKAEVTESPPLPEQTALVIVRDKNGPLRLAEQSVISYEDMGDDSCLGRLDPSHPEFTLLWAIVEWGMGPSKPYVKEILIEGRKLTISFIPASGDIKGLMMLLFPGTGMTAYYKWY